MAQSWIRSGLVILAVCACAYGQQAKKARLALVLRVEVRACAAQYMDHFGRTLTQPQEEAIPRDPKGDSVYALLSFVVRRPLGEGHQGVGRERACEIVVEHRAPGLRF